MGVAEMILVVFLSTALLIFLILAIVAVSLLVGILRDLKKMADRAEEASENLGELIRIAGRRLLPLLISTVTAAVMSKFKKKK